MVYVSLLEVLPVIAAGTLSVSVFIAVMFGGINLSLWVAFDSYISGKWYANLIYWALAPFYLATALLSAAVVFDLLFLAFT